MPNFKTGLEIKKIQNKFFVVTGQLPPPSPPDDDDDDDDTNHVSQITMVFVRVPHSYRLYKERGTKQESNVLLTGLVYALHDTRILFRRTYANEAKA